MNRERQRALWCFLALFLLLTSYYLVKPLRSSFFLKEFDPANLPYFFLVFPFLSLAVTRIFDFFYQRLSRLTLIVCTYGVMIACKLFFFFALPWGGKGITLAFYLWASAYFLLCIAVLWGCISSVFNARAGERLFAFIAFGGMAGAYVGSQLSSWLAKSAWSSQALSLSAVLMAGVLGFLFLALRAAPQPASTPATPSETTSSENSGHSESPTKPRPALWRDLKTIAARPYIRGLAVIVFAVAFMNTVVEFKTQKIIDRQLASREYVTHFAPLNRALCGENCVHEKLFDTVYRLKKAPENAREQQLTTALKSVLSAEQQAQFVPDSYARYERYRSALEGSTRQFFSDLNKWINLIGVFLLLVVARPLFRWCGVRWVVLILPLFFVGTALALLFPVELSMVASLLIGTGALNYSLNKTSKELLYTAADEETRFRFKPLIDGPLVRFGDVFAALLTLLVTRVLHFKDSVADPLVLGVGLLICGFWVVSAYASGVLYDVRKSEDEAC